MVSREILGLLGAVLCFGCGSSERADGSAGTGGGSGESGAGAHGGTSASVGGSAGVGANAGAGGAGAGTSGASGSATGGSAGTSGASGAAGGVSASCPGSTNHTPGTRIRGQFVVTAEGDRAWMGWQDTELDEPCSFHALADGVHRCVPNNWNTSATLYTDAICSAAVYTAGQSAACTPMNYIMSYRPGDCTIPSGYEFFELGAEVAPEAVYALAEDGVCTLVTTPSEALYLRGAPVPPETFVPAQSFTAENDTRVRASGYLAADGTRQVTGWTDTALDGEACSIRMAEDGVRRCLPYGAAVARNYADAACTERVGVFTSSCDGELPRYGMVYADPYCAGDGDVMLEPGEPFTGTVHLGMAEGVCEPSTLPSEEPFSRTTPVPASTFEGMSARTDESDPGRLKPHYHTSADGGCWFWRFWDTELDAGCGFDLAEDGVYRCLPGDMAAFVDRYTDAACSTPARAVSRSTCNDPAVPEYALDVAPGDCETKWRVYRVSAAAAALYRLQAGDCVAVEEPSQYAIATPVEPATFMAGELAVE